MRICPAPWAQRMVGMVAREEGQHLASRSSTAELGAVVSHAGNEESRYAHQLSGVRLG